MHTSAIWGHYSVVSFPLQGSTWGVAAVWCQVFFPSWVPSGLTSSRWKKVKVKVVQSCTTLCDPMDFTVCEILQARILEWVAFPFSTQGSNPVLLHCRWILYQLSHKGSPRILKWVAYPFSSGSSWPRNWTGVSCITGGFLPTELSRKPPASSHWRAAITDDILCLLIRQEIFHFLLWVRAVVYCFFFPSLELVQVLGLVTIDI